MFQQGELVVYGATGVCRIEGLTKLDPRQSKEFYELKPLFQDGVIYTPVDGGKVQMRPVMSPEDARQLLSLIPSLHPEVYHERTLQLLASRYQTALQSGDSRMVLEVALSIRKKRQQAEQLHHRLGMVDEKYGKQAERLLFGELSVALNRTVEEISRYVSAQISAVQTEPLAQEICS